MNIGLSEYEAKKRLAKYGPNILSGKKEFNIFIEFFSHFLNPLILILLFAAGISFFMGQVTDTIIIVMMIFLGVLLDFFQEYSADRSLKKLLETVRTTTLVIRNGKKIEIPVSHVVIGDVILLSSGDMVPADAKIIELNNFFVNQAALTGESFPEEKIISDSNIESDLITEKHNRNIVFRGTNVVSGSCTAVVFKTGKETEIGKIASALTLTFAKSDFEKGITNFGFFLMRIIFVLVIFTFFINAFLKHDYLMSFMFALTIAVGVTPELLPMILSITMAAGVKRMSQNGVIVKKFSSIPNFGSMNILCIDKTGTLTENIITIVRYVDYSGKDKELVLLLAYLNSFFQTGIKNPLDEAIVSYKKMNVNDYEKVDEIPYDFYRKRISVVVKYNNKNILVTKGAPEEVLNCCSLYQDDEKILEFNLDIKKETLNIFQKFSEQGFRVLSVASKEIDIREGYSPKDEIDMIFQGFILLLDPAKKDVKEVVKQLKDLGVESKIITGDNELVTKKICRDVGLDVKGIMLGLELAKFTDVALSVKAQNITIFARCSPIEKERIICALRANNNVVGYLGDGINDAPALKTADVGISVNNAVDIAKESADIVLMHKSLWDLKKGIIEGRKTFSNTMKYLMISLSSNFGNMFSAAAAVLFLPFLPILPIQILLNNLIYDFSQVTIPFDNVDNEWIQKPKRWNLAFVKKFMVTFGLVSSLFDFVTFFFLLHVLKASSTVFQTAWYMESLATQILVILVIRTKKLPILNSRPSLILILNSFVCVAIGWIIPYTFIGKKFQFEPLSLNTILNLMVIIFIYLIIVEITKRIFYKKIDF